jgi:hypothetical protein
MWEIEAALRAAHVNTVDAQDLCRRDFISAARAWTGQVEGLGGRVSAADACATE